MERRRRSWVLALVAIGFLAVPLMAQQHGRIEGSALDVTKRVLPGAEVRLAPGNRGTSTDAQGHFEFDDVAPGNYTVNVSYVGFEPAADTVAVSAGQTAQVEAVLKVQSSKQSVEVTAPRPYGEAEAINTQRTSDNIVDVLPETVITSLPNANVADAVGRLPGVTLERDEGEGKYLQIRGTEPRLSNVTVDGVEISAPENGVRQVKLDVIPADLVGSVELNKTLQPDQSGDAIGGSVNLVTKTAGSVPTLTLYSNAGVTPIDGTRYAREVGGTGGKRFGSKQQFGAILSASFDYNGRGIDDVEPVPDPNSTVAAPLDDNADFRHYLYNRNRYGFGGSLDYTVSPNSSMYLRGLFADFLDSGDRTIYNLNDQGGGPAASSEQRIGDYQIASLALGGNQYLTSSGLLVNWQVSAGRSRMLYPQFDDTTSYTYDGPTSQCTFNSGATAPNPYLPQFAPVCFQEAYNPANFELSDLSLGSNGQSAHLDAAAQVDVTKDFNLNGNPSTLRFGAAVHNSHQFDDSWRVDFTPGTDPATGNPRVFPLTQFIDPSITGSGYYNGNYQAGPFISYTTAQAFVMANQGEFVESSSQGQNSENYSLTERIPAAYVMDTTEFGRYRLSGGVRMEQTSLTTVSPDASNALTVHGSYSYIDFMPDASLQYRLDGSSDIRLAYGRGISRPIPSDMTSAITQDVAVNPHTASIGNPALKPEHGDDFDLLYERYLKPLGVIQAGGFYKHLTDPIVSIQTTPTTGQFSGFRVTQPANAGSARIAGFEFAFEQHFTALPGAMRGLGVTGNYSYATSRAYDVNPGNRTDSPPLLRQAPNTWNLSPTFDLGRYSARVGLAYNQSNIYQYNFTAGSPGGLSGPSGDVYEYTHFQVDAQANIGLPSGFTLTLSGLNLNNAPFGFYQGSPTFMIQREFYHPTYTLGVRWTLGER